MGCGDEKLSKYLTQTFTAHCHAMICQQVTLSGDADWPKVADAVIEALKGNLLHVASEAEKSQIEVDIDIQKVAPKFNGTIQKNQSRYERKRQLYDAAQGIIRKLPS